ncbi:MAG: hypothetical protein WBW69_03840 [Candidatus Korobacteraceae bacterium]
MDKAEPVNQFKEVHRLVKERLDRARDIREKDFEHQKEREKEEARREGFDRA